jgi:hypothetical protein
MRTASLPRHISARMPVCWVVGLLHESNVWTSRASVLQQCGPRLRRAKGPDRNRGNRRRAKEPDAATAARKPLHINSHLERVRCQHCHRLLPEKDGICPACIRKWSTIKRITGYISPHLWSRGASSTMTASPTLLINGMMILECRVVEADAVDS